MLNVFLAIAVDNLADAQSLSDAENNNNEVDELNVRAPSPPAEQVRDELDQRPWSNSFIHLHCTHKAEVKYNNTAHIKLRNQENGQKHKTNTHSIKTGLATNGLLKTVPDNLCDGIFR